MIIAGIVRQTDLTILSRNDFRKNETTQMAKILVIEDDEEMRDLLNMLLIEDGHEVFVAKDGIEGIRRFYQFHPNLVITDIYMPNKDGIEVIRELIEFNPKQAIIAMSGITIVSL